MPEEPPQQPHWNDQLRLRSVPIAFEPLFGWRFLRHEPIAAGRDVVLAAVRVDVEDDPVSRLLTRLVIRVSVAVLGGELAQQVQRHLDREVLARVLAGGEQDLGLGLVGGDVVGDLDAHSARPWYELPRLKR